MSESELHDQEPEIESNLDAETEEWDDDPVDSENLDLEDDWLLEEDDEEIDSEGVLAYANLADPVVPTPGCAVSFFVDNKRHHAVCLAVIGEEILLEHKGASRCFLFTGKVTEIVQRLRAGVASATITVGSLKPCRYHAVPKRWLKELVKTGQSWKGLLGNGRVAALPEELFKDDGQLDLF